MAYKYKIDEFLENLPVKHNKHLVSQIPGILNQKGHPLWMCKKTGNPFRNGTRGIGQLRHHREALPGPGQATACQNRGKKKPQKTRSA
eukprot:gene10097-12384_t